MSVKKIFVILITIVACVIIGALVLNVLLPNASVALVNATEDQIFKASGLQFDLNGDGNVGTNDDTYDAAETSDADDASGDVDGWN